MRSFTLKADDFRNDRNEDVFFVNLCELRDTADNRTSSV
jgi:hypothetical protein